MVELRRPPGKKDSDDVRFGFLTDKRRRAEAGAEVEVRLRGPRSASRRLDPAAGAASWPASPTVCAGRLCQAPGPAHAGEQCQGVGVFLTRPNMTHEAPGQQGGRGVAALPARLRENLQFSPKECFAHDRKTHGEARQVASDCAPPGLWVQVPPRPATGRHSGRPAPGGRRRRALHGAEAGSPSCTDHG